MNKVEFFIDLGNRGTDRLRFKLYKDKGLIIDVVIQFEIFTEEKWMAVVRYDCSHGFFHRDIIRPDGSKEKKVIDVPDLTYAMQFARQDMEDRWEWYKEQFLKLLKS